MKKLLICVLLLATFAGGTALAQPRVTVTQNAPPPEPCAPGQLREQVDHDASGVDETIEIEGLKAPCLELTVHLPKAMDPANKAPVSDAPSSTSKAPEPTREDINDLMKMAEDNLELTNMHEDRIQELENKPSIPGPRGPKGDDGGKSVSISGGFVLQTVFSRGDSQQPNYAGGFVGSIGAGGNPNWMVDLTVNLGTGQCHGRYSNGSLGIRRVLPWSAAIGIGGYGSYCSMVTKPQPEMDQPGDEIGSSHFIGGYTALGLHPHKGLFVKAQVSYGLRTVPAVDDVDRYKDVEAGISLGFLWGN